MVNKVFPGKEGHESSSGQTADDNSNNINGKYGISIHVLRLRERGTIARRQPEKFRGIYIKFGFKSLSAERIYIILIITV